MPEPEVEPSFPHLAHPSFKRLLMQIDDIVTGAAPDTYTVAPANPVTLEPGKRGSTAPSCTAPRLVPGEQLPAT